MCFEPTGRRLYSRRLGIRASENWYLGWDSVMFIYAIMLKYPRLETSPVQQGVMR